MFLNFLTPGTYSSNDNFAIHYLLYLIQYMALRIDRLTQSTGFGKSWLRVLEV